MLSAGICGGSWAGTRWLWTTIEQQIEALTVLRVDIEQARQSLAQLEKKTWRVELREIDGQRFVVLPAGSLERPRWTVGGRPALKLPGECGSCMTALERQLTRAYRELSAQYERERPQHAQQIAALQRQVEHFAGQVTRLIADYRKLAETLRGPWS